MLVDLYKYVVVIHISFECVKFVGFSFIVKFIVFVSVMKEQSLPGFRLP